MGLVLCRRRALIYEEWLCALWHRWYQTRWIALDVEEPCWACLSVLDHHDDGSDCTRNTQTSLNILGSLARFSNRLCRLDALIAGSLALHEQALRLLELRDSLNIGELKVPG